jgi:hypothetical protein
MLATVEEQFMQDLQKAIADLMMKYGDKLKKMSDDGQISLADPSSMGKNCCGSAGTCGSAGGCVGTVGTYGCHVAQTAEE